MFIAGRPSAVAAGEERGAMADVTQDRDRHGLRRPSGGIRLCYPSPLGLPPNHVHETSSDRAFRRMAPTFTLGEAHRRSSLCKPWERVCHPYGRRLLVADPRTCSEAVWVCPG